MGYRKNIRLVHVLPRYFIIIDYHKQNKSFTIPNGKQKVLIERHNIQCLKENGKKYKQWYAQFHKNISRLSKTNLTKTCGPTQRVPDG